MSNKYSGKKVILGFTGSPLSCLTVRLLQEQGMKISAFFFTCDEWSNMIKINQFEKNYVMEKATELGIELTVEDISAVFFPRVIDSSISDRISGKFSSTYWLSKLTIFEYLHYKFVHEKADYVAVSSFTRMDQEGTVFKGKELSLDQSPLMFLLKDKLKHFMFPVGTLLKKDIIHLSYELKIETMDDYLSNSKKTGAAFSLKPFYEFLKFYIPSFLRGRGQVISFQEYVIGFHEGGVYNASIGERFDYTATKGKGAVSDLDAEVVLDIRPDENVIIMGPSKMLLRKRAIARNVVWLSDPLFSEPRKIQVVFDNGASETAHIFYALGNSVLIDFDKITLHASRGRYVAFYNGDILIGGGRISVPIREERYI